MSETDLQNLSDCRYYFQRFLEGKKDRGVIIHQKSCLKCISWLYDNDKSRFQDLLSRAMNAENPNIYNIVRFAAAKGYGAEYPSTTEPENSLLSDIIASTSPYKLPYDIGKMPDIPGVYVIVINNKNSKKVAYVGSTLTLRYRIINHHVKDLQILMSAGVELYVYCLLFPTEGTEETMRATETHLITALEPTLNRTSC
ncbi:hypothetical protein [Nostoc sp. JL23]|uniref:hypothetical protein n=1 Tax=Nostoc sp. JL23 TaxID=2815394 RepID=UPI001D84CEFA|nr:hypothetical protein [Nostoc sp. JL23]MBN3875275.1 GIY-YIG nuclease family protein [Nostoc sp. JL23]